MGISLPDAGNAGNAGVAGVAGAARVADVAPARLTEQAPNAMRRKLALLLLAASLVCGVFAAWFHSPYLAIWKLREAALSKDVETLNSMVDYPSLRSSLKSEVGAMIRQRLGPINAYPDAAAPAAAAVKQGIINAIVDQMVRPEVLALAISRGALDGDVATPTGKDSQSAKTSQFVWDMQRLGPNQVIVFQVAQGHGETGMGLILERAGFIQWKLIGVRLHTSE